MSDKSDCWLLISNLPASVTHENVVHLCCNQGGVKPPIKHIRIRSSKETGKTFAFVCFDDAFDADCTKLCLHNLQYNGEQLYCRRSLHSEAHVQQESEMKEGKKPQTYASLELPNPQLILQHVINKFMRSLQLNAGRPKTVQAVKKILGTICTVAVRIPARDMVLILRRVQEDWTRGVVKASDSAPKNNHIPYNTNSKDLTIQVTARIKKWISEYHSKLDIVKSAPGKIAQFIKPICTWSLDVDITHVFQKLKDDRLIVVNEEEAVTLDDALVSNTVEIYRKPFEVVVRLPVKAAKAEAAEAEAPRATPPPAADEDSEIDCGDLFD